MVDLPQQHILYAGGHNDPLFLSHLAHYVQRPGLCLYIQSPKTRHKIEKLNLFSPGQYRFCGLPEAGTGQAHWTRCKQFALQRSNTLQHWDPGFYALKDPAVELRKPFIRFLSLSRFNGELMMVEALAGLIAGHQASSSEQHQYVLFTGLLSPAEVQALLGNKPNVQVILLPLNPNASPHFLHVALKQLESEYQAEHAEILKDPYADDILAASEDQEDALSHAAGEPALVRFFSGLKRQPRKTVLGLFREVYRAMRRFYRHQVKPLLAFALSLLYPVAWLLEKATRPFLLLYRKAYLFARLEVYYGNPWIYTLLSRKGLQLIVSLRGNFSLPALFQNVQLLVKMEPEAAIVFSIGKPSNIPARLKVLKPVIERLLVERKRVKLIAFMAHLDADIYMDVLGPAVMNHFLFSLHHVPYLSPSKGGEYQTFDKALFPANQERIASVLETGLPLEEKMLLLNAAAQYGHLKKTAVSLNQVFAFFPGQHIIGTLDVHFLTILSQLRKHHHRDTRIHGVQFGVAALRDCMDCLDFDTFFVSDEAAQAVYEAAGCNAGQYRIVGNPEWEAPLLADSAKNPIERFDQGFCGMVGVFTQPLDGSGMSCEVMLLVYQGIFDFAARHPDIGILIKPHYRDDIARLKAIIPPRNNILLLESRVDNTPIFQGIDVAVSFFSAVLQSALANGVPAAAFCGPPEFHQLYSQLEQHGGHYAPDLNDAMAWLETYFTDTALQAKYKAKAKAYQLALLENLPSTQIVSHLYS